MSGRAVRVVHLAAAFTRSPSEIAVERLHDHAVARLHAARLDCVADRAARDDPRPHGTAVGHHEHRLLARPLDDRLLRHHGHRLALGRAHLALEERDLGAHVRQHPVVALEEPDLHQHRRLGAVDGRHDPVHDAGEAVVGHRVELDLARLADLDLAERGLGDVGLDLERVHVGDRDHRAPGVGGLRERRDVVADVRALGKHDAIERGADQSLVDGDLGSLEARLRDAEGRLARAHRRPRLLEARDRRVERRAADVLLLRELARAVEVGLRVPQLRPRLLDVRRGDLHVRRRLIALRSDVAVLEPSDHLALLHAAALHHTQPFEASGRLRRDRRLALRDDVAGRVERRHRLRRVGSGHRRRFDRLRGAEADVDGDSRRE